jgi:hypothetical protein
MRNISSINLFLCQALSIGGFTSAYAHEPFMDCYLENEQTVICEAGYEDGSSAKNEDRIFIKDNNRNTLLSGNFTDGLFSFQKPKDEYIVVFVGGEIGHVKRILGNDIHRK